MSAPTGAGKTTTSCGILATLDEPSEGDCTVDGVSVVQEPEKIRRLIGFMPDTLRTLRDLTVREYLDFFARAYGLRGSHRRSAIASVEEFTNLTGINQKTLKALSKGMKQRVSLARALIHDPPLLIMDEPAAGLDPRARIELRELLRVLAQRGKAILISSHILTELSEICDGAVIIERGKILRAGMLHEIINGRTDADAAMAPRRTLTIRPLARLDELYQGPPPDAAGRVGVGRHAGDRNRNRRRGRRLLRRARGRDPVGLPRRRVHASSGPTSSRSSWT